MDDFLKYFEDKQFVRHVYQPDEETEAYWKKYLQDHPEEINQIEQARLILSHLKSKSEKKSKIEASDIFVSVLQKLDYHKASAKRRLWISVTRYAAVALIFLTIGIIWKSMNNPSALQKFNEQFAENAPHDQSDVKLIMAEGKSILIKQKESNVEYKHNGQIVINQQDTIQEKNSSNTVGINQLIVPYGKNSMISLSDGTIAYLNAGSKLTYPSTFEGKTREVFLVGEGFFKVRPNPERPFIVKTNKLDVTALGTSFNVSSYPIDKIIEVVLVEGKVGLKENGFNFFKKQQILKPDQLATYDQESMNSTIKNVNIENYVTWYKGYLNFKSTDLDRVIVKLERYYDITIDLFEPLMGSRKITGKLKLKENKDNVLAVMASTAEAELIKMDEKHYKLK